MNLVEKWSKAEREKRKKNCSNPKGFTMKQFCKNQKTRSKEGQKTNEENEMTKEFLIQIIKEELEAVLDEKRKKKKKKKKKEGKKDACYYKVRARYSVWPSAYASGALVKCRKVGAKNWGNKSKKK